jgi:hypothetical protein
MTTVALKVPQDKLQLFLSRVQAAGKEILGETYSYEVLGQLILSSPSLLDDQKKILLVKPTFHIPSGEELTQLKLVTQKRQEQEAYDDGMKRYRTILEKICQAVIEERKRHTLPISIIPYLDGSIKNYWDFRDWFILVARRHGWSINSHDVIYILS